MRVRVVQTARGYAAEAGAAVKFSTGIDLTVNQAGKVEEERRARVVRRRVEIPEERKERSRRLRDITIRMQAVTELLYVVGDRLLRYGWSLGVERELERLKSEWQELREEEKELLNG